MCDYCGKPCDSPPDEDGEIVCAKCKKSLELTREDSWREDSN